MRAVTLGMLLATLQPPSTTVLARLDAYLATYEGHLSVLIADERMTQTDNQAARSFDQPAWRRLDSEIAFVRLPGNGPWLGYRHVTKVDGRRTPQEPGRLQALLAKGANEERRAFEMALESARYNLGLARTTNVPTMPLELMSVRHRARFLIAVHGVERIGGRRLRRISFIEITRPTLIQDPNGGGVISEGSIWVEDGTGRVFETEVRWRADTESPRPPPETILRVSFAEHAALGLLVPVRMRETFWIGNRTGQGDARYTNYRRFTTSARIVP